MRTPIRITLLAALAVSPAALAGFTGLTISRQIEAGALLADASTTQDFREKLNFAPGVWTDSVQANIARDSMTVDSRSSQSTRVTSTRFDGTSHLTQFVRTLNTATGRSTGSSEFLVHFNIQNFVDFSYFYDFFINMGAGDNRQAHAQVLLMRLDDSVIFLNEQITSGRVTRGGTLTLQPARYAFLIESAMLIENHGPEMHDGSVVASFDFKMIPTPGAATLAGLFVLAATRRRRG